MAHFQGEETYLLVCFAEVAKMQSEIGSFTTASMPTLGGKKRFIYFQDTERETGRREEREIFILMDSSNSCSSWGWAKL